MSKCPTSLVRYLQRALKKLRIPAEAAGVLNLNRMFAGCYFGAAEKSGRMRREIIAGIRENVAAGQRRAGGPVEEHLQQHVIGSVGVAGVGKKRARHAAHPGLPEGDRTAFVQIDISGRRALVEGRRRGNVRGLETAAAAYGHSRSPWRRWSRGRPV